MTVFVAGDNAGLREQPVRRGQFHRVIVALPLVAWLALTFSLSSLSLRNYCCRMQFSIKPVSGARIPELLGMIRELAVFEKLEHEVAATEESLRSAFLGPNPVAGALFASCDGKPAGYAIYFFTFSSFVGRAGIWLDDLYVKPDFRKQGLGRLLIAAVARVGVDRNCGRYEWSALDWNSNALDFYRKLGAHVMDDWLLLRLDSAGMRCLADPPPPGLPR